MHPQETSVDEVRVETRKPSATRVVFQLLLSLIISLLLACGGFYAAYSALEERDRNLAGKEVAEYVQKVAPRVAEMREHPAVHKLEVLVSPEDSSVVLIQAEVDDIVTERLVREKFDDVNMERFEPTWDFTLRKPVDATSPKPIIIPSIGVVRAYSVRATLAAGAAGIVFTAVFTFMIFVTLRSAFR